MGKIRGLQQGLVGHLGWGGEEMRAAPSWGASPFPGAALQGPLDSCLGPSPLAWQG